MHCQGPTSEKVQLESATHGRIQPDIFHRIKSFEKFSELFSETFHLASPWIKHYCTPTLYHLLHSAHHTFEDLEPIAHVACTVKDITEIYHGKFNVYTGKGLHRKLNYIATASKIFHFISHYIASSCLGYRLFLERSESDTVRSVQRILHTIGFGCMAVSLIRDWINGRASNSFSADMKIHAGGTLFEGFSVVAEWPGLQVVHPAAVRLMYKLASLSGIIHSLGYFTHPHFNKVKITNLTQAEGNKLEIVRKQ